MAKDWSQPPTRGELLDAMLAMQTLSTALFGLHLDDEGDDKRRRIYEYLEAFEKLNDTIADIAGWNNDG